MELEMELDLGCPMMKTYEHSKAIEHSLIQKLWPGKGNPHIMPNQFDCFQDP